MRNVQLASAIFIINTSHYVEGNGSKWTLAGTSKIISLTQVVYLEYGMFLFVISPNLMELKSFVHNTRYMDQCLPRLKALRSTAVRQIPVVSVGSDHKMPANDMASRHLHHSRVH